MLLFDKKQLTRASDELSTSQHSTLQEASLPSIAPSLLAHVPQQSGPNSEPLRQVMQQRIQGRHSDPRWLKARDPEDLRDRPSMENYSEEFVPDSQLSAADYLAPDDVEMAYGGRGSSTGAGAEVPKK